MKRLLIIFLFLFGVFMEAQAQAPGLVGKRHVFFADYAFFFSPGSIQPYYYTPEGSDVLNNFRSSFRSKFQFSYDYQLKRNLSAGITYSFNRGGVDYYWRDAATEEYIWRENAHYIGHTFLPCLKVFRLRGEAGGGIAPVGTYWVYRLGVAFQSLPEIPEIGAEKSSLLSAGGGLGLGRNIIVGKKLLLNFGGELLYFRSLGGNHPYLASNLFEDNGLGMDYMFNIRLGLGFAAF